MKEDYGFTVDLSKSKWANAMEYFKEMPWEEYKNRPHKMAYHNLCINSTPPAAIGQLLGLGLKFCIQTPVPSESGLSLGLKRFERDVRLNYEFAGTREKIINKKIYIKSNYEPNPTNPQLKTMIREFCNRVREEREKIV